MAIVFKEKVTIKPTDAPEVAAKRLEVQLDKYFPISAADPTSYSFDQTNWQLRDPSGSSSEGASIDEVFGEFREHELEPTSLFHDRRLPSQKPDERGVLVGIYYRIQDKAIYLSIEGTDRMAVDGAAATCQRIKRTIEKPMDPSAEDIHLRPQPGGHMSASGMQRTLPEISHPVVVESSPSSSWLKRTWKDHTAQFLITLIAGVLVVAIGLWLGLSPKP